MRTFVNGFRDTEYHKETSFSKTMPSRLPRYQKAKQIFYLPKWSRVFAPNYRNRLKSKVLSFVKPANEIAVIGAPLVYGQPLHGACCAPELLRSARLLTSLQSKGIKITDYGDLEFDIISDDIGYLPGCKYAKTVGLANKIIAEEVAKTLKTHKRVLLLGGDHSVGIGSVAGHSQVNKDLALIWVDAHADINTPLTSNSGNLHGMPLSFLIKELPQHSPPVPGMEWVKPCISANQVAYIGLRSVDQWEKMCINSLNMAAYHMDDVRQYGIDFVVEAALKRIDPDGRRPVHFSFDVDALDPSIVPATGTKVPDGLSLREGLRIARLIYKTGRLAVMDIVELNPLLTCKEQAYFSADIIVEIAIRALSGRRARNIGTLKEVLPPPESILNI